MTRRHNFAFFLLIPFTYASIQATLSIPDITDEYARLNSSVEGRLSKGTPLALPCAIASGTRSEECVQIQQGYLDEAQWETCQTTGAQCLLDYTNTSNLSPIAPPRECLLGSIPPYFIDVQSEKDVQAAFKFSEHLKMPLVIKNTGHDYKGRSSAPNALALWTHNLKDISYDSEFVPEGCSTPSPAVTLGAGVQWKDAYAFAENHNITLVEVWSDSTVGAAGGWLQGGGHSMLSNTMGLGKCCGIFPLDNLQFKVVTPDGQYRVANACRNQDLFFALRGGGGGTFGVVMESTVLASPQVTLQLVVVSFNSTDSAWTRELWDTMAANALQWAEDGWGGIATSNIAIYINPKLDATEASQSMKPLVELGKKLQSSQVEGAQIITKTFGSWGKFYEWFAADNVAITGISLALVSRLIPKANFATAESQAELVQGLLDTSLATPRLIILISAPSSFPGDNSTSVTEAWRSSIYHITAVSSWNWDATKEEKKNSYAKASASIDNLRRITPDAAYQNEADVYEPNHEISFWGSNYERLLEIKYK
ncbi:hypothetical protein BDP27DRAFT_1319624 [Rhodocollybia butyracea]|uniref:FAD-binding PCMH-type domain-containing protein n=1 Tax=Rhodocollybia butyracea TaxID=206335 RepID=A0A9P5Q2I5_9AGAR|nr:hypothetical protein BDP27DRAFT_1319624 [Rhodocollybia butyracea]